MPLCLLMKRHMGVSTESERDERPQDTGGEAWMSKTAMSSHFQELIETIEALPPDDQKLLIDIIGSRPG